MKRQPILAIAMLLAQLLVPARATSLAQMPIDALSIVKPNIIFGLDDSGSMDWEVMMNSNNGSAWYNTSSKSFWDTTTSPPAPYFNSGGVESSTWIEYNYLFPNGCSADTRHYCDGDARYGYYAVPPIDAFAFFRSSSYNPLYYNPGINYSAWPAAYYSGATQVFAAAGATAVKSNPLSAASPVLDLTALSRASTAANHTFKMVSGMTIPGATIANISGSRNGGAFSNILTNTLVAPGDTWDVNIPYFPATYYVRITTVCPAAATCVAAPEGPYAATGVQLQKVEIKATTPSFPSGRSYAAELQNFANWFQYARKRKLMLAYAMGNVLSTLTGVRAGAVKFNANAPVTMYDFDAAADSANAKALLGIIYNNAASSGTPTRQTLKYIGDQYTSNKAIVQYACQRNAAFVLTDGYAQNSNVAPPAYNAATYGGTRPYSTTFAGGLADIALSYYTNNLRPDLTRGLVPLDIYTSGPAADQNPNLHMSTYALTLGAKGRIFPSAADPYAAPPTWANPNVDYDPTAVDDLWHATINGRGLMFTATNTNSLVTYVQQAMMDIILRAGSQSAIAVANVNMTLANSAVYVSSYNSGGWFGDINKYPINLSSGVIDMLHPIWASKTQLDAQSPSARKIFTWTGAAGVGFNASALSDTMKTALNPAGVHAASTDNLINYLRGDRSLEGTLFRSRVHVMGDAVNAEPVVNSGPVGAYALSGYNEFRATRSKQTVVYQAANDGMLHAVDGLTGNEMWAYIPGAVLGQLGKLAQANYVHQFYVDGTPVVGDVLTGGSWRSILVGGLGAGGVNAGASYFYALDITASGYATEAAAAAAALWEFPVTKTDKSNMGIALGKPVIINTPIGWAVVVSSGYNNTAGDGKGHVWFLNPATGAVLRELVTPDGSKEAPVGLAGLSAYALAPNTDPTALYLYGGDELGNLWKFNITHSNSALWTVTKVAQLRDGSGSAQAVTTAPELARAADGVPLIFVGTGRLLGSVDLTDAAQNSFYAIRDTGRATLLRADLAAKILTVDPVTGNRVLASSGTCSLLDGWYYDFPVAGERVVGDPVAAVGEVMFTTNVLSPNACSTSSYFYAFTFDCAIPPTAVPGTNAWAGTFLGNFGGSRPVPLRLPNGRFEAVVHTSNNAAPGIPIYGAASRAPKSVSWKEIIR